MKATVVGAGLSGLTAAVLLKRAGWKATVFETREHFGGNCWDMPIEGWLVHQYGPHIFHTNNFKVYDFLSQFTKWEAYTHRVLARTPFCDRLLPIPYCSKTQEIIGRPLSDAEICDWFFRDYSAKMWGISWEELPETIRNRVPERRVNGDDRYFTDPWQGMPLLGYSDLFQRMVDEIGDLNVLCGVDADEWKKEKPALVVYTGSIDEYFGFSHGYLPYRTLNIQHGFIASPQPVAVINECDSNPVTRQVDYSRFYRSMPCPATKATGLFPQSKEKPMAWEPGTDRFYPMNWGDGKRIYEEYSRLTTVGPKTIFCGRLGAYQYLNMDAAVANVMGALASVTKQE